MHFQALLTPFPHVSCTLGNFWKIRTFSIFFVPIPCLATSENTSQTSLRDLQPHIKSLRNNENGRPETQNALPDTSNTFSTRFTHFGELLGNFIKNDIFRLDTLPCHAVEGARLGRLHGIPIEFLLKRLYKTRFFRKCVNRFLVGNPRGGIPLFLTLFQSRTLRKKLMMKKWVPPKQ